MSGSGSYESGDHTTTLGRGRGRGSRADPELPDTASSTSSTKRSADPNGNGNGNGNGKNRGSMRDQTQLAFYRTRPESSVNSKAGSSGTKLKLSANYFKLVKKPDFEFTLYRVDFEPDVDNPMMRKAFVRKHLGGFLYDGVNMIYLTHKLPRDTMEFECISREDVKYKLTIKSTGTQILPTDARAVQILNVLLRRAMGCLKLQVVGRNLYDPENKVKLSQFKLELWPGYITSIRQHEIDVLVCTEISHKVMRQETVYDLLSDARNGASRDWQETFKKEIIGTIVLTDYNNNTYRVDDVDFNSSPRGTFNMKGVDVSYKDYYEQRYGRVIRDPNQPMLVSNAKARDIRDGRAEKVVLVPELCRATGLTDRMRSNFVQMKAMAEHTQMDPNNRTNRLIQFAKRLRETKESNDQMLAFKTEMEGKLIQFEGRKLNQEEMLFGAGKTFRNDDKVDWTFACKSNQMYVSVELSRWLYIYPQRIARDAEEFLAMMMKVASGMHFVVGDPKRVELPDDRSVSYTKAIEQYAPKDPKLIVLIVTNNAADRYAAIKRSTCVHRAIPTQVVVLKTIQPKKGKNGPDMSITTKVMIQINAKLGGAPWMIKFPMAGTMTIGFDVTHSTKDKTKSFGAFVASMDLKKNVRYFSAVSAHSQGEEISSNIETHLVQALKAYNNLHGTLPDRIFFYRDGVGDGQIEYVHQHEVVRLQKKLDEIYNKSGAGKKPKFSFIIVNKRLNTRIFLNSGPRPENPPSGTIVDSTITMPERYDFYLVSQCVRQGTVAPTSYNIIHDTNGLSPEQMQIITYKQTHLYYNWSGTVRVPAVVQYAHKLAFLVGTFLHQSPSTGFDNQLYFL